MVKQDIKASISEDDGESGILNDNGKRANIDKNKEGKKRLKTKSLYRQPTVKELNRLQETENLFNSNLFRLQIEEILTEVKVTEKVEKKFQQWFTDFRTYLLSIPEDADEYNLSERTLTKKLKVKLPCGKDLKETKCVFKFHKFDDVRIAGSYALGCSINSKLTIDLQITVPAATYTKNDSINYRYHKKRAAYLAVITSHLSKSDLIDNLHYSWRDGNNTKPVLELEPSGKLKNYFTISLNLVCDPETFKLHRYSPLRNNLRETWMFSLESSESSNDLGPPTPYYNSSVLSDLTALANQDLLKEILLESDNLKQAVVLLKIWIRQRNLQVSGFIISLIVAYYVQKKRVNNVMSSYQIIRNIWIVLKTSEWDKNGISLEKSERSDMQAFHDRFPVVFLDCTGQYNLCWEMSKGTYDALRRESSLAVDMLDNGKSNSFIPLFMTPVDAFTKFDHILRFKDLNALKQSVLSRSPKEHQLNYGLNKLALVTDSLYSLLAKGLGNRADLIMPLLESNFKWPVKKSLDKEMSDRYEEKLAFGIVVNPENFNNTVQKGPAANLREAEEFRAFWGDKSELRRFQDGAITETLVWAGETAADRRTVVKQIIDYLIDLKFGIPPSDLFHVFDQLDSVLARKQYIGECTLRCEESSFGALKAFDELRRDLRQITELPLDISAVYGVSSVFSCSSPLPPLPSREGRNPWRRGHSSLIKEMERDGLPSLPEYTPVCKAIIELGHSGKWPGDLQAFRCLKAAFHLQIAERLKQQYSLPAQAYPAHLDVLKNGLTFRLAIAHPKELTLLRKEIEDGVAKFRESEESVKLQCDTILMPRLRGALHGLHTKHPSFGPTACLLKRWLSCCLLSPPHFPAVVAELVTAVVFVQSQPSLPPCHPTVGLVRTLRLLANTDWSKEIIFLDFNEDMSREEIAEIELKFNSGEIPSPCLRIVTAYDDKMPSIWSAEAPSLQVLTRVQVLARSTLNFLEGKLLTDFKDNVLGVFVPSLCGYDVIIHLHPSLVPHVAERVDKPPRLTPLPTRLAEEVIPVVEFHPVLTYLEELRSAYSEFALFFHDLYGGEVIAVLWKPDIGEDKDFQIANVNALKPYTVAGETKYKINIEAIVEDFRILGRGLVKEITFNV